MKSGALSISPTTVVETAYIEPENSIFVEGAPLAGNSFDHTIFSRILDRERCIVAVFVTCPIATSFRMQRISATNDSKLSIVVGVVVIAGNRRNEGIGRTHCRKETTSTKVCWII